MSDLRQTPTSPPTCVASGDPVVLRFGACCPTHGAGAVTDVEAGTAILSVAEARWCLRRCPSGGGIDVPGLVAEDWFVVARAN